MTTKAYYRFKQRCDYYDSSLELCDLLLVNFRNIPDSAQKLATALGSTVAAHPYLGRRRNTQASRNVVGGHMRRAFYGAFIKDIFEEFEEFVGETMARAAQKGVNPAQFVGNVRPDIEAKAILGAGDWNSVVKLISDDVFRKIQNERSTIKVVRGMVDRLGLEIPALTIDAAMPYLDARHMLVHQDGRAPAEYRAQYPNVPVEAGKINLSRQFSTDAKAAIDNLAKAIDEEIIKRDLVLATHIHP